MKALPCGHGSLSFKGLRHDDGKRVFECATCKQVFAFTIKDTTLHGYDILVDSSVRLPIENLNIKRDKPDYTLVYKSFLDAITCSRKEGIEKYGDKDNWLTCESELFVKALLRHAVQITNLYMDKNAVDDSREDISVHLRNLACNVMFLIERLNKRGEL